MSNAAIVETTRNSDEFAIKLGPPQPLDPRIIMSEPDPLPEGSRTGTAGSKLDGTYRRKTLPSWMEEDSSSGDLQILRLEAVNRALPKNPFIIRASIEQWINGKIEGAFPENKGQMYCLKVRRKDHIERLLKLTTLIDNTNVQLSLHPTLNVCRCVVSCADIIDIPTEDLKEHLKDQKVIDVRRITKKVDDKRVNTPALVLTISGTVVPETIEFGWLRARTRPYYPAPMLCYKCWTFGHTKTRCPRSTAVCGHCSGEHEVAEDQKCSKPPLCSRCNTSEHNISSRKCPDYVREDEIQHIRVDNGISYPAARRIYDASRSNQNYAKIVCAGKDQQIAELSAKLDDVMKQLAEKEERIKQLEFGKSQNNRLITAQKHGTIDDLVSQIEQLRNDSIKKDKEISILRKLNNQAATPTTSKNQRAPQEYSDGGSQETKNLRSTKKSSHNVVGTITPKRASVIGKTVKPKLAKQATDDRPQLQHSDSSDGLGSDGLGDDPMVGAFIELN